MNPKNDKKDNKNNNFFNQNPLLVFAIFSIVVIMVFKNFLAQEDGLGAVSGLGADTKTVTKNINYYEFKELIKKSQLTYVAIGQTIIKGLKEDGNGQSIYLVKKIGEDATLIPLLDEQKNSLWRI